MANVNLANKYFIRKKETDSWSDITTQFDGLKILSIDGFNEQGDAVNVFSQQWIDSQEEDWLVTTQDQSQNDIIIRQNVDLQMNIIVSRKHASTNIEEQSVYDSFVSYLNGGDFYIKSSYVNKYAHVICLKSFKPTAQKLQRGERSFILATITLHTLDAPTIVPAPSQTQTAAQT